MIDDEALKSLERLHQLKTDGIITEEDFEGAKRKILRTEGASKTKFSGNNLLSNPQKNGSLPADDDYIAWIMLPLKRYADFNGRSCRKEFWMFQLLYVAIFIVAGVFMAGDQDVYGEPGPLAGMALFLAVTALLGLFIPLIALEVRRFHDQNKPGTLALLNLIPWAGQLVIFILMFTEGTKGENQYGVDPYDE